LQPYNPIIIIELFAGVDLKGAGALIISSHQIQMVLRLYGAQKSQPYEEQRTDKAEQNNLPQGDRAELSSEALDYRKLREAVLNVPETRDDRVREIKNALQKGEYNVSADQIAEKILGRYLVDHLV